MNQAEKKRATSVFHSMDSNHRFGSTEHSLHRKENISKLNFIKWQWNKLLMWRMLKAGTSLITYFTLRVVWQTIRWMICYRKQGLTMSVARPGSEAPLASARYQPSAFSAMPPLKKCRKCCGSQHRSLSFIRLLRKPIAMWCGFTLITIPIRSGKLALERYLHLIAAIDRCFNQEMGMCADVSKSS